MPDRNVTVGTIEEAGIRNFCIVAHVDHGKSTLADRILEITGAVPKEKMRAQFMDQLEIERERGITIKAAAARLRYASKSGRVYQLNLIDTPGHVDFSYEVSRSLAACEGAILVVDASQGVEAQTVSNFFLAKKNGLTVLPVLNKCDLAQADGERAVRQLRELGVDTSTVLRISAKTGAGVEDMLEALVRTFPSPRSLTKEEPGVLKALIFDSTYDNFRGVVAHVRIFNGKIKAHDRVRLWASGIESAVSEVGYFSPTQTRMKVLQEGEVGYVAAGWKNLQDVRVGDTLILAEARPAEPLPGYQRIKPMVYAGLFPTDGELYESLKNALEKLALNDSALAIEPEVSEALGFGFKCGFLGLLHMEIVSERLSRELGIETLIASPTVVYQVRIRDTGGGKKTVEVRSASDMPLANVESVEEPRISAMLFTPTESVGPVMQLLEDRRGVLEEMNYLDPQKVILKYDLPLSEVITDFYDRLKSLSNGYASFDYEFKNYAPADMRKLEVLLNGKPVDALSLIVHKDSSQRTAKSVAAKLSSAIPRQLFEVAVQVASNGRIIARETIKALRKNVTAKCYGGDITRKRKLLERQKEGKKRMKQIGSVEIPKEAFLSILKSGDFNLPSTKSKP